MVGRLKHGPSAFPAGGGEKFSAERALLLQRRISDLALRIEGTRLEKLVQRLYGELETAGISIKPPVYLSDEWGCPDRLPTIGVPFYLADEGLTRLEEEMMEGVEAETDDEIMRYLRHEAGHAFNYAYRLYESDKWQKLFGPFARPYLEDYTPRPFSHNYVRHLSGWYAQKHPDEDFAETFAVWLAPDSRWRDLYQGWGCFAKLEYVERTVADLRGRPALVTADGYDTAEEGLRTSVEEHYLRNRPKPGEVPPFLDHGLRDVFEPARKTALADDGKTEPALDFLRRHRRALVRQVSYWSGLSEWAVRDLLNHIQLRCAELGLRVKTNREEVLVELAVFVTTLCMNKLLAGEFVSR